MSWTHCAHPDISDTVPCPTCGTTKASWTLQVDATRTFTVGRKAKRTREKTAWLEVELTGCAGAECEVEHADGSVVQGRLDDAGRLRHEQMYPGEVRVRFPGRAVEWVGHGEGHAPTDEERAAYAGDDAGWITGVTERRHVFQCRVEGARLIWPPAGTHTQWVNLKPHPDHPERGDVLRLRVGDAGRTPGGRLYVRVVPLEGNSLRDVPRPGLVGGLPLEGAPRWTGLETALPAPGREATFDIELGCAGGDRFEVSVGTTRECLGGTVSITTWRRLHYQLTRGAHHPVGTLEGARAALADAYIALERLAEVVLEPHGAGAPPGTWLPAEELKLTDQGLPAGPRLVVGNHNMAWAESLRRGPLPQPAIHVLVADTIYDGNDARGAPLSERMTFDLEGPDTGRWIKQAGSYDLLPTAVQTGRPCLREGRWTTRDGRSGEVTPDDVQIIFNHGKVLVAPRGVVASPADPVSVELDLLVALGPKEGRSVGAHTVVCFSKGPWMDLVVAHEIGHALRQAGQVVAPGLTRGSHFYNGKGQNGWHCSHGLSEGELREQSYNTIDGHCVMFGRTDTARETVWNQGKLCEACLPFFKADHARCLGGTRDDPPPWSEV